MLLVIYKEEDTIEGYVEDEKGFDDWLKAHNKRRKEEGELKENKGEFTLKPIDKLEGAE